MPKNAIVVGMPRSGTSLSAAIFARKDYFVAEQDSDELREGDQYNPFGYFEAESLIEKNVEVFKAVGYDAHNSWTSTEIPDTCAALINDTQPLPGHREFMAEQNTHSPWVWKDPRLCYTIGYWWQLVDKENTGVLLLRRSPQDIFQSFLRVGWRKDTEQDQADAYRRIDNHLKAAKAALEKFSIPHIEINYKDYIEHPDETAAKIGEFFGIKLTAADLNAKSNLDHSSKKGRMYFSIEKLSSLFPRSLKAALKKLLPNSLLAWIRPDLHYTKKAKQGK